MGIYAAMVDGTSICPPPMALTPTTVECKRQNGSIVVVHYIALRARCDKRAVCESPDDATFCSHYVLNPLHRYSPGFAVGIRRWLAEEDSAKMREQLRGERAVRKSVEQQFAKERLLCASRWSSNVQKLKLKLKPKASKASFLR